jgi:hypothetical protein
MSKINPPKRLAVGWTSSSDNICVIEPIKISNRAKVAIKIDNEYRFNRNRNEKKGKIMINNNYREGFKIIDTDSLLHVNASKFPVALEHPDFKGKILLKPRQLVELNMHSKIERGKVMEPLIYVNNKYGFLPKSRIDEINESLDNQKEILKKLREKLSEYKIKKDNLVPGSCYFTLTAAGDKRFKIFLGKNDGKFLFVELYQNTEQIPKYPYWNVVNSARVHELPLWKKIKPARDLQTYTDPTNGIMASYINIWFSALKSPQTLYKPTTEEVQNYNLLSGLGEHEKEIFHMAVQNMEV